MTVQTRIKVDATPHVASMVSAGLERMSAAASDEILALRSVGHSAAEAGGGHQVLTAAVVKLLDSARLALGTNRAAAETCIARVSTMLLAEEERLTHEVGRAPTSVARGGLAPWQLRRVTAHIDALLGAPIRVRDFEEITGLSASYFARAFKVSVGQSVHAYIIRRRIERAQEMMVTTDDPLCEIAVACGLCDQAHLSRLFRRIVGLSPNVWRRQWPRDEVAVSANRAAVRSAMREPSQRGSGSRHDVALAS
jgi:AraC family transcriptional regulator